MAVFTIYKPIGLSPLGAVNKFRAENPQYSNSKISYAGRLDPLARGKMTLLTDEDRFEVKKFLEMDKVYFFKVILGLTTDTYDLLGIPKEKPLKEKIEIRNIKKFTKKYRGNIKQKYPAYSAKTVRGKKLFWWARQKRIKEIIIPSKDIFIYDLEYLGNEKKSKEKLLNYINGRINRVDGDFRQKEIKNAWKGLFNKSKRSGYIVYSFRVHCSSGTYVRTIAYKLGKYLETSAVCMDINRTKLIFSHPDGSSHKALR